MTQRACPTFEELSRLFSARNREVIASHLSTCASCARAWSDLEVLREAAREIPTRTPNAAEAIRMEDALVAAALAPPPLAPRWRRAVAPIAAAAIAAGVTLFVASRPSAPALQTIVAASDDARYERFTRADEGSAAREVVRVRGGRIAIDAPSARADDRVEVVTGDGTIDVLGSAFDVVVVDDRLESVFVRSGQVAVHVPGGSTRIVRLGERWTRAEAVVLAEGRRRETSDASRERGGLGANGEGASSLEGTAGGAGGSGADVEASARAAGERAGVDASSARGAPGHRADESAGRRGSPTVDRVGPAAPGVEPAGVPARRGLDSRARGGPGSRGPGSFGARASKAAGSERTHADASAPKSADPARAGADGSAATVAGSGRARADASAAKVAGSERAGAEGSDAAPSADASDATPPVPTPAERAFASGWRALRGGDPARAAEQFAEALRSQPGGALAEDARYWRAVALARDEDEEATAAMRAYLEHHAGGRRAPEVALMLAWRRLAAGDRDAARALFERARRTGDDRVKSAAERGLEAL